MPYMPYFFLFTLLVSPLYTNKAQAAPPPCPTAKDFRIETFSKKSLSGCDFTGMDLKGAKLTQSNLSGAIFYKADLRGADLRGANLTGANLEAAILGTILPNDKSANMEGAVLEKANLQGARLDYVNLSYANLKGANLQETSLLMTKFYKTNFSRALMPNINFSLTQTMEEAVFYGAHANGAVFANANLTGARFGAPPPDLFQDSHMFQEWAQGLEDADFRGADLTFAHMGDMNLRGLKCQRCILNSAYFGKSHLIGANFDNAKNKDGGVDFTAADLTKASFKDFFSIDANFNKATLNEANFTNAKVVNGTFFGTQALFAKFMKSFLSGSTFKNATLSFSDFSESYCQETRFIRSRVEGTVFDKASFVDARFQGMKDETQTTGMSLKWASFLGAKWRGGPEMKDNTFVDSPVPLNLILAMDFDPPLFPNLFSTPDDDDSELDDFDLFDEGDASGQLSEEELKSLYSDLVDLNKDFGHLNDELDFISDKLEDAHEAFDDIRRLWGSKYDFTGGDEPEEEL